MQRLANYFGVHWHSRRVFSGPVPHNVKFKVDFNSSFEAEFILEEELHLFLSLDLVNVFNFELALVDGEVGDFDFS